ncbi:uncharacterized protein BJ171DRAFT_566741 [Polychytrium aggregatum]|uniref:uncharacterized protein n=1 Tax=Polychytrium aggregatum TaxID=110093 RepID=UPI0022FF4471|nr:uncharacterized protein BJ171DRAFT_566741 [Polychytrium aggregatum]KAI9206404.1 hypothetical protein BJ171DRAFT_566741 [Polychytrium aggregatum]
MHKFNLKAAEFSPFAPPVSMPESGRNEALAYIDDEDNRDAGDEHREYHDDSEYYDDGEYYDGEECQVYPEDDEQDGYHEDDAEGGIDPSGKQGAADIHGNPSDDDDDDDDDPTLMSLTLMEMIQTVFSDLDVDRIDAIVRDCNYDISQILDRLCVDTEDQKTSQLLAPLPTPAPASAPTPTPTPTPTPASATAGSRTICRHFLAGGCYRSDCWYSHDTRDVICKFWAKGFCSKGSGCEFVHGADLAGRLSNAVEHKSAASASIRPNPRPTSKPSVPINSLDEFPSLGGPNKSSSASGPAATSKHVRAIDLRTPSNFAGAVAKVPSVAPANALYGTQPLPSVAAKPIRAKFVASELTTSRAKAHQRHRASGGSRLDWRETGDTLAAQYDKFREEAKEVAVARNKLFQLATQAYVSGNRGAAKALSLQAHKLNEQMEALNWQAAEATFQHRNESDSAGEARCTIDLHGLHPSEAIHFLSQRLETLKREIARRGTHRTLQIITGTGHHSQGREKLRPLVKRFLVENQYRFYERGMGDGLGGILCIDL